MRLKREEKERERETFRAKIPGLRLLTGQKNNIGEMEGEKQIRIKEEEGDGDGKGGKN